MNDERQTCVDSLVRCCFLLARKLYAYIGKSAIIWSSSEKNPFGNGPISPEKLNINFTSGSWKNEYFFFFWWRREKEYNIYYLCDNNAMENSALNKVYMFFFLSAHWDPFVTTMRKRLTFDILLSLDMFLNTMRRIKRMDRMKIHWVGLTRWLNIKYTRMVIAFNSFFGLRLVILSNILRFMNVQTGFNVWKMYTSGWYFPIIFVLLNIFSKLSENSNHNRLLTWALYFNIRIKGQNVPFMKYDVCLFSSHSAFL